MIKTTPNKVLFSQDKQRYHCKLNLFSIFPRETEKYPVCVEVVVPAFGNSDKFWT
jgi:hypothetical protein